MTGPDHLPRKAEGPAARKWSTIVSAQSLGLDWARAASDDPARPVSSNSFAGGDGAPVQPPFLQEDFLTANRLSRHVQFRARGIPGYAAGSEWAGGDETDRKAACRRARWRGQARPGSLDEPIRAVGWALIRRAGGWGEF